MKILEKLDLEPGEIIFIFIGAAIWIVSIWIKVINYFIN